MCNIEACSEDALPLPAAPDEADRRKFLLGLASLPLATVLAYPELAKAAAAGLSEVKLPLANGKLAEGALAMPDDLAKDPQRKAPAILLFHEWWGLNDQIKAVASEYAKLGYITLAANLYHKPAATDASEARSLSSSFSFEQAKPEIEALLTHLRKLPQANGKVATIGWCFGGMVSINSAIEFHPDAAVIYYGRLPQYAGELMSLKTPLLGHFGTKDQSINQAMVDGFTKAAKEADVDHLFTAYWYEANHAFANPTGNNYVSEAAKLSWERTLAFLKQHIG